MLKAKAVLFSPNSSLKMTEAMELSQMSSNSFLLHLHFICGCEGYDRHKFVQS